jgi:hypothetical protein
MLGHPVRQTSRPFIFFFLDYMKEKSATRDELLQRIMDGAALIQNNHESMPKATCAVLKNVLACAWPMQVISNCKPQVRALIHNVP